MKKAVLIGNASAFWGDSPEASVCLLQQQPSLDFITLDYLSELSMSIMAIQQEKEPESGYARDFIDVICSLIPAWLEGNRCKLITNAGGMNPLGCAEACLSELKKHGCKKKIGVILGDNVLAMLASDLNHSDYCNLETGEGLSSIRESLVTANVYIGAQPIVKALEQGCDIVIGGRIADPSLTVAAAMFHHGWKDDDYHKIANATIAGHLIECGTQVTGGISTNWLHIQDPIEIPYPYVEIASDGSFVITKPPNTGGAVNVETVKEQLLYELGDPDQYLSPDATVSFLGLKLTQEAENRIKIEGGRGSPPPKRYKVSATYRCGYKIEAFLAILGPDLGVKAQLCGEIILKKVQKAGHSIEKYRIDVIGAGAIVPGVIYPVEPPIEAMLRIAAADREWEALNCLAKEVASLVTCGPQGVTGYSSGRPHIRPVFGFWPCLIERALIHSQVIVLEGAC